MNVTTRWLDTTDNTLDQIITKILEPTDDKAFPNRTSSINVVTNKAFDENKTFIFDGRNIYYNLINYFYDSVVSGESPIEDRTTLVKGTIIVYSNGTKVNYIIDKNSSSLTELRWLIGYTGRGEIEKNKSSFDSKLFVWVISKLFNSDNVFDITQRTRDDITLSLDSVIGFKGQTDDLISYVSADGDSVLNILSTLSFLLESKMLQQIKLRLEFADHANIEVTLKDTQTISVNLRRYIGPYDDYGKNQLICELYLLVYLEIIPHLTNIYRVEEGTLWDAEAEKNFLQSVGAKLIEKVAERVKEKEQEERQEQVEEPEDTEL